MKKDFFNKFQRQEKNQSRTLSLAESEWDLIEAYRLFGSAKTGYDLTIHSLLREIILTHIQKNKEFSNAQQEWLNQCKEIKNAASLDGFQ